MTNFLLAVLVIVSFSYSNCSLFSIVQERIKRDNPFANRNGNFQNPFLNVPLTNQNQNLPTPPPIPNPQGPNSQIPQGPNPQIPQDGLNPQIPQSGPNPQFPQGPNPHIPQGGPNPQIPQGPNPQIPQIPGKPNVIAPNSNFNFATQNGLTVPAFQKPLGGSFLGDKLGANVDLTNPSVSANRGFDGFGLVNANEGISKVGDRGQGNFGGAFGRSASILGGRYGIGDQTDVNVNKNNGLNLNRQRGIPGILTDTSGISSNPLSGNFFGTNQQTCIGEMFIKGLCFQKQVGIGK